MKIKTTKVSYILLYNIRFRRYISIRTRLRAVPTPAVHSNIQYVNIVAVTIGLSFYI